MVDAHDWDNTYCVIGKHVDEFFESARPARRYCGGHYGVQCHSTGCSDSADTCSVGLVFDSVCCGGFCFWFELRGLFDSKKVCLVRPRHSPLAQLR